MFRNLSARAMQAFTLISRRNFRVCVYGATGNVGQPLSLLLKRHPLVTELALYDLRLVQGVKMDLAHINTECMVTGFEGPEQMENALSCSEIVVIVASKAAGRLQSRAELFDANADIVTKATQGIVKYCPKALVVVITNPVNSNVPLVAEIMKQAGTYDPKRLFGLTTLDTVRAITFISEILNVDCIKVKVQVIGGHDGATIIPLLSQVTPKLPLDSENRGKLRKCIQEAGDHVVKAKDGAGSSSLSAAHAGIRFIDSLLRGLNDENATDSAYIESKVCESPFWASPFTLGKEGITKVLDQPPMNQEEQQLVEEAIKLLKPEIEKGIAYAKSKGTPQAVEKKK